jgi:large subunit ribosomal protein L35
MKLKTRKSVAKRINKKGNIFLRKKAYKGHLLRKKSSSRLRRLSRPSIIHNSDIRALKLMLPYA